MQRILKSRELYEARQAAKGEKAVAEEAVSKREAKQQDAIHLETERTAAR